MNSLTFFESFFQDLRFILRTLAKAPAFTSVVVLSLVLGIGANTAIFSLINAALLKMLPVRNPEQLVQLKGVDYWFPYPVYKNFRDHNQVFSGVVAFQSLNDMDVEVNGRGAIAKGQVVSGNYFPVLGINAIVGRTILAQDDNAPGGSSVAVISYEYWARRFGLDPAVIGKEIVINNAPFTIIGVSPPEFFGLQPGERIDVSIPLTTIEKVWPGYAARGTPYYVLTCPFRNWIRVMGRLKPGVTPERALANLEPTYRQAVSEALQALNGSPFTRRTILHSRLELAPGGQGLGALRQRFSKPLLILMAGVTLLLLITCANVANLLLARANARSKEIAVRLTVGAGRLRLIRQFMTESVLLASAGGGLGLLLAFWASHSLVALLLRSSTPISLSVSPNGSVLVFTLVVSLIAALFFGLMPALRAARPDFAPALVEITRAAGRSGGRSRFARSLIVLQIATSFVLLAGAGLLVRSLRNLKNLYPGFNKDNVLLFAVNPDLVGYKDTDALYRTLLERIRRLPGVQAASFSMNTPLSGHFSATTVKVEESGKELIPAELNLVGPAYFTTLETSILRGRDFTDADQARAPKVAIVNESFAHYFFGDSNPLGRRISIPDWVADPSWCQIIGVVRDDVQLDLRQPPRPAAYMPASQSGLPSGVSFEIRTAIKPAAITTAVLHTIAQVDSRLPVFDIRTLDEQLDDSLIAERLIAALSTVFGAVALLLACVGLYGLTTYAINRRTAEFGIRMALGATRVEITGMVLRETSELLLIGLGIGIPSGIAAARLIQSELYGLKSYDPGTMLSAVFIMASIAVWAAYLPARRAARVDPMAALRTE